MLRIILASLAAVAGGTIGGLTLVAALPDFVPMVQLASQASAIADPSPKEPAPTPVVAPKRAAAAAPPAPPAQTAPAPAAPTPPAPSPKATPADATPDKPTIQFDGERVSVRFGKFKIDF